MQTEFRGSGIYVWNDLLISTNHSKNFVCYGLFKTHCRTVSVLFANYMMPLESLSFYLS